MQIHDELIFEVEASGAEALRARVRAAMQEAWPSGLRVPLRVQIKQGLSWGELQVVTEHEQ